jgi:hypothetical protein
MPSKINASVSSGLVVDSDLTGSLQLQTGGNPAISIDSSQVVNFTKQFQFGGVLPPAFSAYGAALTSVSNTTFTKLIYGTEEFDTNNNYASSRFTPTVAGYYSITASSTGPTSGGAGINIFKNGSSFKAGTLIPGAATDGCYLIASALIYFNGSTDYVELYAYQRTGGTINMGSNSQDFAFQGILVRAA